MEKDILYPVGWTDPVEVIEDRKPVISANKPMAFALLASLVNTRPVEYQMAIEKIIARFPLRWEEARAIVEEFDMERHPEKFESKDAGELGKVIP